MASGKTILTALRQGLIRVVAAVVVRVTGPFRLDAVAVLTLELVVTTPTGCDSSNRERVNIDRAVTEVSGARVCVVCMRVCVCVCVCCMYARVRVRVCVCVCCIYVCVRVCA